MSCASQRRSYDTDDITLRNISARLPANNKPVQTYHTLTADGKGGCYWVTPFSYSTLMTPAFNEVYTTTGRYIPDVSYNILTLTAQSGIGFQKGAKKNELGIYAQTFSEIDVSGSNIIRAYYADIAKYMPQLKYVGANEVVLQSDSQTNTIFIDSVGVPISSVLDTFAKVEVYENVSSIVSDLTNSYAPVYLNANNFSSVFKFMGFEEIYLSTDQNINTSFVGLYHNRGPLVPLSNSASWDYVKYTDFSTAVESLSTTSLLYLSAGISTTYGLSSIVGVKIANLPFSTYTLLISSSRTTSNIGSMFSTISTSLNYQFTSTVANLGQIYTSSINNGFNFFSSALTAATRTSGTFIGSPYPPTDTYISCFLVSTCSFMDSKFFNRFTTLNHCFLEYEYSFIANKYTIGNYDKTINPLMGVFYDTTSVMYNNTPDSASAYTLYSSAQFENGISNSNSFIGRCQFDLDYTRLNTCITNGWPIQILHTIGPLYRHDIPTNNDYAGLNTSTILMNTNKLHVSVLN